MRALLSFLVSRYPNMVQPLRYHPSLHQKRSDLFWPDTFHFREVRLSNAQRNIVTATKDCQTKLFVI